MKATKWMTTLMLAGGLLGGSAFAQVDHDYEEFSDIYGVMDAQVGQAERVEHDRGDKALDTADEEFSMGRSEESQEAGRDELSTASQYELLG